MAVCLPGGPLISMLRRSLGAGGGVPGCVPHPPKKKLHSASRSARKAPERAPEKPAPLFGVGCPFWCRVFPCCPVDTYISFYGVSFTLWALWPLKSFPCLDSCALLYGIYPHTVGGSTHFFRALVHRCDSNPTMGLRPILIFPVFPFLFCI